MGEVVPTINVLGKIIEYQNFSTENFQFLQLEKSLYIAWTCFHNELKLPSNDVHLLSCNVVCKLGSIKVASYLADFDTRWPHEYEIFNFARFSSRIWLKANIEPTYTRSLPMFTRCLHDGHTNGSRLYPKHSRRHRNW